MGVPTDSSEKDRISRLEGKVTETQLTIAQLLAKERELSQIIESMPIAAFVINRAHSITHLNVAFEHLTEVKRRTSSTRRSSGRPSMPAGRRR